MTNNTAMVPVPLYPTEEMKRAGMERMAQAQRDGSASFYAYAAVCWEAMIERYQEEATPAEDVRLVSYAEDMSTCTLTKGDDGQGYFYDRIDAEDVRAVVDGTLTDEGTIVQVVDNYQDTSAVVDEPVAEIDPDARHLSVLALHDVMESVPCSSLYSLAEAVLDAGYAKSHPQRPADLQCSEVNPQCSELLRTQGRPVVMPERRNVDPYNAETIMQWHKDCEWNACLDEFARLNK